MIQVKLIAPNAEQYVHYARRFGAQLRSSGQQSLNRVFEGFIFRAVRKSDDLVVVYVLALPSMWLFGAEFSDDRYDTLPEGIRFDSAAPIGWKLAENAVPSDEPYQEAHAVDLAQLYATAGTHIFQSEGAISSFPEPRQGPSSPLIPCGNTITLTKQYGVLSGESEGVFGPTWFTNMGAYAGSSSFARFVLDEGEADKISYADANYLAFQLYDTACSVIFGIDNLALNIGACTILDGEDFTYGQGHNIGTQAFMVRNPTTGKRTDMVAVMPLIQTRVPPEYHQFAHDHGDDRIRAVYGHGVLRADLSMTAEQKEALGESVLQPIGSRITAASALLLSDYPGHEIQTYQAAVYDDKETPSPADDEYLVFEPLMPEENRILLMGSAVQESAGDPPATPRTLKPGELPDYYGPVRVVVANTTVYEQRDPACPGRRLTEPGSGTSEQPGPDSDPDHWTYIKVKTQVFTHTIGDDGAVSVESVTMDSIDMVLYVSPALSAPDWTIDRNADWGWGVEWGEYYPMTAPGSTFDIRYFYCPTGQAIPVSRITISEWIGPAAPGEPGPDNEGQQDPDSARFCLIYPGGTETVFDLGGMSPPRPIMRGMWFQDFFKSFAQFAYDTNSYGAEAAVQGTANPQPWYGLGSVLDKDSDAGFSWMAGSTDPDKVCRRTARIADTCQHQKIHAHIGNGKIAVLATNHSTSRLSWSLVTCFESTGALDEVRGVIFEDLPLESSCWVSLTMVSGEKSNDEGQITTEAVLIASLQRPRARFAPAAARHQIQGRGFPWMMDDTIQPDKNMDTRCLHRISRDGGRTWHDFIEGMPGDGYWLGTPLKSRDHTG